MRITALIGGDIKLALALVVSKSTVIHRVCNPILVETPSNVPTEILVDVLLSAPVYFSCSYLRSPIL